MPVGLPAWAMAAWPGFCAIFVGIGMGRFGYTPLVPFLISAGWISESEAGYLGAWNLGGYLAGAILAVWAGRRFGIPTALRATFVLSTLSLAACALPLGFGWYAGWRFLIGVSGAVLMILTPSAVLAATAAARRGRTGGAMYTGVGCGIAVASLLIAPVAARSVTVAWLVLTVIAVLLTCSCWRLLDRCAVVRPAAGSGLPAARGIPLVAWMLVIAYALDGAGMAPHSIFWVDFVDRELQQGAAAGAVAWLLFGAGAATGPIILGFAGDRIGLGRVIVIAYAIKAVGVIAPAFWTMTPVLVASSYFAGALSPGIASVIAGQFAAQLDPVRQARAWGIATLGLALLQSAGAYGFSALYGTVGTYRPLFLCAGVLEAVATVFAILALRRRVG